MAYRVLPYTKEETPTQINTSSAATPPQDEMGRRLEKIEAALKSLAENGGKFDGLL